MELIFFIIAVLFPFFPEIVKKKYDFRDIILLFFLYLDISLIFVQQTVYYTYLAYLIVLLFSFKYLFLNTSAFPKYFKSLRNIIFAFLAVFLVFPIFQNENIDQSTRFFSVTFTSIILLPLAIKYYSSRGNIHRLLRFGYYFILIWCVFVVLATIFKLGGVESERVAGKIFYLGSVATRGGLTYICFALMLVPLIWNILKKSERFVIFFCVVFVFLVFFAALKRFVFVAIALAVGNYLIKSKVNSGLKVGIVAIMLLMIILIPSNPYTRQVVLERYDERGGESKYTFESVESDIRLDEPLIAFEYIKKRGLTGLLIGIKTNLEIEIEYNEFKGIRAIHNEYAMLLLKFGFIGVLLYLSILISLYQKTLKLKRINDKIGNDVNEYWIVFQNLIMIFMIEGIVGGHSHITFRGLVLFYGGAIAGYLYQSTKIIFARKHNEANIAMATERRGRKPL